MKLRFNLPLLLSAFLFNTFAFALDNEEQQNLFSTSSVNGGNDLSALASDLILPPDSRGKGPAACLILISGAQIPARYYNDLAMRIMGQAKAAESIELWVGIPSFFADLAVRKDDVAKKIAAVHQKLLDIGMAKSTPVFLVGHSLGAQAIQDYVMASSQNDVIVSGSIFLGASLNRKYNGTVYPTPWMTVAGELDGLQRPTRVAQGYYHYVLNPKYSQPHLNSAVVIIEGMNHMQFSEGSVPFVPKLLELKPELDDFEARTRAAEVISSFIVSHVTKSSEAESKLLRASQWTDEFMKPIIKALEMEASAYLKKPCNSDNPSPHCPFYPAWPLQKDARQPSNDTDCFCGTPWASVAIKMMANLPGHKYQVYSVDAIHDVRDTKPFHHAHTWNNCTLGPFPCTMNLTSVSELKYDRFEELDTGFTHATALEIRVKMKSRQVYWRSSVDPQAPYSVEDDLVCSKINQLAIDWAIENAGEKARARYLKHGQKIKLLPDYYFPVSIGPLWINKNLKMDSKVENGEKFLFVQSIAMKTEIDSWVNRLHPDSGGQHYCKLLSPARVMEWIYTDGLRYRLGLSVNSS